MEKSASKAVLTRWPWVEPASPRSPASSGVPLSSENGKEEVVSVLQVFLYAGYWKKRILGQHNWQMEAAGISSHHWRIRSKRESIRVHLDGGYTRIPIEKACKSFGCG